MKLLILALILILTLNKDTPPQQPVIGIYTQDAQTFLTDLKDSHTYIAASYVKNLQMAGAQVVPIFYHSTEAQLASLLSKINGVFFPGGQMPIDFNNHWTSNFAYIYEYASKKNREGQVYPIWATCLGFETLMYITSGSADNTTVFTEVFGQDSITRPLIVKGDDSELLQSLSMEEYEDATTGDGIFFFHHRWAVLLQTYNDNPAWRGVWNLVTTSKTPEGVEFVGTLQSREFPFFMTQYHPQKNSFQWRVSAKRTYNSISAEQKFINVFMSYARQNTNVYPLDELKKDLIYNYQPVLTPLDYAFVQVYIFDESSVGRNNLQVDQ